MAGGQVVESHVIMRKGVEIIIEANFFFKYERN